MPSTDDHTATDTSTGRKSVSAMSRDTLLTDADIDELVGETEAYAAQQHGAEGFSEAAFDWAFDCALFMAAERRKTVGQFINEVSGTLCDYSGEEG